MFFDALAALFVTFFCALGMVEVAQWLLKNPLRKKIKHRVFVIAKINSAPKDDIEPALRSIFAETDGMRRNVFLDCDGASDEAVDICKKLEQRFDCSLFRSNEELFSMLSNSLQENKKTL